ncbi:MAG: hypothetical protein K1060chlam5_00590 [Candidatus Anoxychlamydiales bacterium]|nr:hypothetical protein [Candidatus Anoxychlamydiales bacterium]
MSFDFQKATDGRYIKEVTTIQEKDYLPYGTGLSDPLKLEIDQLFHTLTSFSAVELLSKAYNCIIFGKHVAVIHPFTAWEYILSNIERKEGLKELYKRYESDLQEEQQGWSFASLLTAMKVNEQLVKISRSQTIQGLPIVLQKRHELKHLDPHVEEFCQKLKLDQAHVKKIISDNNFEELVKYIIFI